MNHENAGRRWYRVLPLAALAWLFIVGLLILEFGPDLPKSKSRWLLFIAVGPPLYILGEAFFGWLFSREHGDALSPRRFSVARVLIALPVVLLVLALCWVLSCILAKP
jgi:uncharacterized membrane protein SirB2